MLLYFRSNIYSLSSVSAPHPVAAYGVVCLLHPHDSWLSISFSSCSAGDEISCLDIAQYHQRQEEEGGDGEHGHAGDESACGWLVGNRIDQEFVAGCGASTFCATVLEVLLLGCMGLTHEITGQEDDSHGQVRRLNANISVEDLAVAPTNAVVDPWAVMIEDVDAPLALVAVPAPWSSKNSTLETKGCSIVFAHQG